MIRLPIELSTTSFIDHIPTGFELRMITEDKTEIPVNSAQMLMHTNTFGAFIFGFKNFAKKLPSLKLALYMNPEEATPLCIPWLIDHIPDCVRYRSEKGTIRDTPFESVSYDTIVSIPPEIIDILRPILNKYGVWYSFRTSIREIMASVRDHVFSNGLYMIYTAGEDIFTLIPTFSTYKYRFTMFEDIEKEYDESFSRILDKTLVQTKEYISFKENIKELTSKIHKHTPTYDHLRPNEEITQHRKRLLDIYEETSTIVMNSGKLYADSFPLGSKKIQEQRINNYPICIQTSMEYEFILLDDPIEQEPITETPKRNTWRWSSV